MFAGALDIGGTKTIVAIVNKDGSILSKRKIKTEIIDYKVHFLNCIKLLDECLNEISIKRSDLIGLGINLPGMVNSSLGLLYNAPYAGWKDVKVTDFFHWNTKIKNIYIENDVNSCALGEMYFGETSDNFLWITISTGIGGAIVVNKNLIKGSSFCAGEIGHMKVEYESPYKCSCGQYGCLEAHASGTALTRMFKELIQRDADYRNKLTEFKLCPDASGMAYLAKHNDENCIEIFKLCGTYIGRALSNAINLLNPKEIFLGGGVIDSYALIIGEINLQIRQNTVKKCSEVNIKPTALGYEAALLGSAALVFTNEN
ncbi:MAG TPA: ROK family protein [Clostridiaceae bacterium]